MKHAKAVAAVAAGLMVVAAVPATASLASVRSPGATRPSATSTPVHVIFTPWLAKDLAITSPDKAGDPVELKANTGDASQIWTIASPGNPSDKTTIVNSKTGLCLNADQHAADTTITAAACDGSLGEQWVESGVSNGTWRLSSFGLASPLLQASAEVGTDLLRLAGQSASDTLLLDWIEQ